MVLHSQRDRVFIHELVRQVSLDQAALPASRIAYHYHLEDQIVLPCRWGHYIKIITHTTRSTSKEGRCLKVSTIRSNYSGIGFRIHKKYNNKISMIPNPSDPTGLGLYSKYARNHAMKSKSHSHTSNAKPKSLKPIEPQRKKSIDSDAFSRQESRDQRERRYQRDEPPPVGQYNPNQLQRPKLVWDILKAYHQESHKRSTIESQVSQQRSQHRISASGPTEVQLEGMITNNPQHMLSTGDSLMSSKTSQCMVNMSRMTGRKEQLKQSESWEERDGDILPSLAYLKGSITKNINFDKMQSHPSNTRSRINPATNYSFDYKVLKQKKAAMLDFSFIKGRQEKPKKQPTYAYQHYEYDDYVRDKNSRVYPNTKTHLIEFRRQINRYQKAQ